MPKKKTKKRLFDLDALEVSTVPAGKNGRDFLITKQSYKGEQMDEILKELLKSELKDEAAIDEKIVSMLPEKIQKEAEEVSKIQGTMKAAVRLLQGISKQLPEDQRAKLLGNLGDLSGLGEVKKEAEPKKPAPFESKEEKKAKEAKKADEDKKPVAKEAKLDEETQNKIDLILKSNEKLGTENESLKEEIKKERDLRVTKEFEDRASKEFSKIGPSAEVGAVLKSAKDTMSEDQYKSFEKVMKSNQAKLEAGNIFTELGSSQGASTDLEGKITVAKEAIRKENSNLSKEQVEEKVFEQNPELYNQYLDENPAQGGY